MRILLVDDNKTSLTLLTKLVDSLDHCLPIAFETPIGVLDAMPELDFDIAIIDFQMPWMTGVELLAEIFKFEKYRDKPIVFVTADTDLATRMAALDAGAVDFLNKPVNPTEFKLRIRNLAALADARNKLADRASWLREEVEKAVSELREREREIIYRLTLAAGYKDPETGRHTVRVGAYSESIARSYGLSEKFCTDIGVAAPMHDIGKVAIPDAVLLKSGKLTEGEFAQMQRHAEVGSDILGKSASSLLQLAAEIAGSHHERWDGKGYPYGLAGLDIPLSGRIVAIADNFDALTTPRPYKEAWTVSDTLTHILGQSGQQFDPDCVEAFKNAVPTILSIMDAERDMDCVRSVA
ncbi:HD domain-containing phosphohydrolase [Rhizobium sp.]|uniref:HD-GYP domain-containing protein n=1 Tax=Rhizobium sp. TaxID=391 RepID=UPI0028A8B52E